jgi:DNA-binding NarL/FixJ family response regulator
LTIIHAKAGSVVATAAALKPEVAIVSEELEGKPGKGFEITRELRVAASSTQTVMLLDSEKRHPVVEAFRSGARGVFCRSDPLQRLARCVHKVHEGQLWISSTQLEFLLESLARGPLTRIVDARGMHLLSRREEEVVHWLAQGSTNGQIASELKISQNTVKNYLFRIFNKLGVSSRVEVLIYAANQSARGPSMRVELPASRDKAAS